MLKAWSAGVGTLFAFVGVCWADSLQLTSGEQLKATVTKYSNNSFETRGTDGKTTQYPANKVKQIEFEALGVPAKIVNRTRGAQEAKITAFKKGAFVLEGEEKPLSQTFVERIQFVPERAQEIEIITHGQPVDIKQHLVPGSVTIVEFYADWCGPCRMIAPSLEGLVKSDPQVVLRKIDIINWGSAVAQQYKVSSIPHLMVYGRKGQLVGEVRGANVQAVQQFVAQAKSG